MANYVKIIPQKNQFNESSKDDKLLMITTTAPDSSGDNDDVIEAFETLGIGGGTVDNTSVNTAIEEDAAATRVSLGFDSINVKDYGAIGDGIANDTVAIQNAIAAAKTAKKAIYVPKGTYLVTDTLVLDWAGAHIYGDGAQDSNASEIVTTLTSNPLISIPGDYNHTKIRRIKLDGPGRATSTSYGINLRGDLVGGSNIDFLEVSDVEINGFQHGIYFRGVANSTVIRVSTEDCTYGIETVGNCNSNTFQNCAFVCSDGSMTGTVGIILGGGGGNSIVSCDMGAPTLEWCVQDGATGTNIIGGNWESYGSGYKAIQSTSFASISGLVIQQKGVASTDRWSIWVTANGANINGCNLQIVNTANSSAIKSDSTISRRLFVRGCGNIKADLYASSVYNATVNVGDAFPTQASGSGEAASATNHGAFYRQFAAGVNDSLNTSVKNSADTYAWANLLDFYFLKSAAGSNPAWVGSSNTFTASPQTLSNATTPYFKIHTGTDTQPNRALWGIATATNSGITGTVSNDTFLASRSGGSLIFGGNTSGNTQTARIKLKDSGVLNFVTAPSQYADNTAALAGGLVAGDVYKTSTGQLMIVY